MALSGDFQYPISTRALSKWADRNLLLVNAVEDRTHFVYEYEGSTCDDGGTAFLSRLHVEIGPERLGHPVERAWIEIPEDQIEAAREMCSVKSQGEGFFRSLENPPWFISMPIEKAIRKPIQVNHAGCYCRGPMVNQKWQMVLSTIHYRLTRRD